MRRVRILMYHRVAYLNDDYNMQAVTPVNFENHMRHLRDHYDILRLDDPIEKWFQNQSGDAVIITFDDGYYDFFQNVVPVMEKYNIPATVFVSTGNINSCYENWTDSILRAVFSDVKQKDRLTLQTEYYDGSFPTESWGEKYTLYRFIRNLFIASPADKRGEYEEFLLNWAGLNKKGRESRRIMTSEELRQVATHKEISIGAHTVTHCSLRHQNQAEQQYEITESKSVLEKITGREIKLFAYPFGRKEHYSDITISLLKAAGFEKAVVAYPGEISEKTNLYELNRFMVKNYDVSDFEDYMEQVVFGNEKAVYHHEEPFEKKPVYYVGPLQEDDILTSNSPLVIWGAGYWGRRLYSELSMMGLASRVKAFGDNDDKKLGLIISDNIFVLDLAAVKKMQKNNQCHILIKGSYAFEICRNLIRDGVDKIHLIT